jgi:hypothetical protein
VEKAAAKAAAGMPLKRRILTAAEKGEEEEVVAYPL